MRRAIALATSVFLAGCSCTAVGCDNLVRYVVPFDVERDVTYSAEMCFDGACVVGDLRVEGSASTRAVEGSLTLWEDTNELELAIGEGDFGGRHEISVEIAGPDGEVLAKVADSVELTRSQPNGPFCEPTCWSAVIGP